MGEPKNEQSIKGTPDTQERDSNLPAFYIQAEDAYKSRLNEFLNEQNQVGQAEEPVTEEDRTRTFLRLGLLRSNAGEAMEALAAEAIRAGTEARAIVNQMCENNEDPTEAAKTMVKAVKSQEPLVKRFNELMKEQELFNVYRDNYISRQLKLDNSGRLGEILSMKGARRDPVLGNMIEEVKERAEKYGPAIEKEKVSWWKEFFDTVHEL